MSQNSQSRRLIIYEDAALAAGGDFAAQNDRFVFLVDSVSFQNLRDQLLSLAFGFKDGGDDGFLCPGTNDVGGSFVAQQKGEGVDQDGLAGSRLPGQQVQAGSELYRYVVDDRVVFQPQLEEHGFP